MDKLEHVIEGAIREISDALMAQREGLNALDYDYAQGYSEGISEGLALALDLVKSTQFAEETRIIGRIDDDVASYKISAFIGGKRYV